MMKLFDVLTEDNFYLFASHHYDSPHCLSIEEFEEDLARFKYIKRLLRKYKNSGEIQAQLVLNHIIILYNVFSIPAANRMCFFKLEPELWPALKTFLVYLDFLPENERVEIPVDQKIVAVLRQL